LYLIIRPGVINIHIVEENLDDSAFVSDKIHNFAGRIDLGGRPFGKLYLKRGIGAVGGIVDVEHGIHLEIRRSFHCHIEPSGFCVSVLIADLDVEPLSDGNGKVRIRLRPNRFSGPICFVFGSNTPEKGSANTFLFWDWNWDWNWGQSRFFFKICGLFFSNPTLAVITE